MARALIAWCDDPNDPNTCDSEMVQSSVMSYSTDSTVASVSLSANKTSGQPLGTTVTWTATPTLGAPPVS